MYVILWTLLALGLVFLAVLIAARHSRSISPPLVMPPGETLPTTPVQRLVRWSLILGLPLALAAGAAVAWFGPTVYDDDDAIRLWVTGLLLASLLVLAAPALLVSAWSSRGDEKLDERDRAILARAPAGQAAAILVVLAVWIIALQEGYRGGAGIPATFLNLIFWSCLLVSLVASNVGILVGYRRT
jgi:purine-cytosine permease-like protein